MNAVVLIAALAAGMLSVSLPSEAEPPAKIPRIGLLSIVAIANALGLAIPQAVLIGVEQVIQ